MAQNNCRFIFINNMHRLLPPEKQAPHGSQRNISSVPPTDVGCSAPLQGRGHDSVDKQISPLINTGGCNQME